MATFEFGKNVEDVQDPALLPEEFYRVRIDGEPKKEENKDKTGHNIVLKLRTVTDEPETNGRQFTKWMSVPKPADNEKIYNGKTLFDIKVDGNKAIAEAFMGQKIDEGSTFELDAGMEAYWFIVQKPSYKDPEKIVNDLSDKIGPKAV